MKIRNIVFSGFMASILMAGAAYADTVLATKGYVDDAYKAAKSLVTTETARAEAAETENATAISEHKADSVAHITAAERTAWNAKQAALSDTQLSAVDSGITATRVATYDGYAAAINAKADASDVYTKSETYTKNEVAAEIADAIDDISGTSGSLTTLQATVAGHTESIADNAEAISAEETRATTAENALSGRLTTAEGDISTLKSGKANVASTLAGYGITDAYTTTAADGKFETIANVNTLAGRVTTAEGDIDTLESGKQDKLTTAQQNAVDSGITSTKVAAYDAYDTGKQDTLDSAQLAAVNSGATATLIGKITTNESAISSLQAKKCSTTSCYVDNNGAYQSFTLTGTWVAPTE